MTSQKKVKLLISFALLIIVTLFAVTVFQLVNIIIKQNKLNEQQQIIAQLEEKLDYYNNKQPESEYETIS